MRTRAGRREDCSQDLQLSLVHLKQVLLRKLRQDQLWKLTRSVRQAQDSQQAQWKVRKPAQDLRRAHLRLRTLQDAQRHVEWLQKACDSNARTKQLPGQRPQLCYAAPMIRT